ncbi:MAG: penicillin amidase, partial [Roseivirga sp.]
GQDAQTIDLKYTQHGPVTYVDEKNLVAYAVRCAWLEPGGSPYLASLRMDQAQTWEEFREACNYSHIPGENMIWADKKGNIGWQAVGIAPVRNNFSGLVPVPGDGRYEWDGYLPIIQKPNDLNPEKGFIATANQNVIPEDYDKWNAVGYTWADPFRGDRVSEVLADGNAFTMEDMQALQVDYLSLPARTLTPMLMNLSLSGQAEEARNKLEDWSFILEATSVEAAVYVAFENQLSVLASQKFIPKELKGIVNRVQLTKIIEWLNNPEEHFGANASQKRDELLAEAFYKGIEYLNESLGEDMNNWQYGQEKYKHTAMPHALGDLVTADLKAKMNLGPLPRGGNSYTPGSTGGNNRQSSGASFRMIVNTGDWDAAVATNGPGQSGNPESPFYSNLFEPWAKDQYFPVYYSKEKINEVSVEKTVLKPKK